MLIHYPINIEWRWGMYSFTDSTTILSTPLPRLSDSRLFQLGLDYSQLYVLKASNARQAGLSCANPAIATLPAANPS